MSVKWCKLIQDKVSLHVRSLMLIIKQIIMEQKPKSKKIMAVIMMSFVFIIVCCKDEPVDSDSDSGPDTTEEATRLYPDDLTYQGAFRVPRDRSSVNGGAWYGRGYTSASTMNWDSKNNSILMPGLSNGANYMGGFIPAQPVISATKNAKELNTAVMNASLPFTDLSNGLQHIAKENFHILTSAYFDGQRYLWTLLNTYDVSVGTSERLGVSSAWASDKVVQVSNLSNQPSRQWARWIVDIDDQ